MSISIIIITSYGTVLPYFIHHVFFFLQQRQPKQIIIQQAPPQASSPVILASSDGDRSLDNEAFDEADVGNQGAGKVVVQ